MIQFLAVLLFGYLLPMIGVSYVVYLVLMSRIAWPHLLSREV